MKSDGPEGSNAARTPARKTDRPSQRPGGAHSLLGTVLSGRYRIERVIGEGGMGSVYEAEHTHMRKRLAIKVLHPEMSRLPEVVARFEREAMAAAHIDHPNVATATDFGKLDDGSFFLVLEYVEGKSLREVIGKGRFTLGRSLHVVRQIANGLLRAHAMGIVHRDLKPENVMLVQRDEDPDFVKVLDFGIAKIPVGGLGTGNAAPGQPVLTQLGMVYGTPEYMAPEQALGQPVDARADLYALGVIAYELMTGVRPFDHESKVTLLGMHVTAPVPPMASKAPEAVVPPEVEAIVIKLLSKEATLRHADAKELIDAINAATQFLHAQGRITNLPVSLAPSNARGAEPLSQRGSQAGIGQTGSSPSLPNGPSSLAGQPPGSPSLADAPAMSAPRSMPPPPGRLRLIVLGIAVGALALVGIVTFLIVSAMKPSQTAAGGPGTSSAGSPGSGASTIAAIASDDPPPKPPPPPLAPAIEAVVEESKTNIEKGNFATAIEALAPLAEKHKDRAEIHALLERAYVGAKQLKDAMKSAGRWIAADDAAIGDLKLEEDVRNAALGKDGADEAFVLLEAHMKTTGVDILWDIAYGTSGKLYPQAAFRATRSLAKAEVRALGSKTLVLALELRDYKPCDQKHALIVRAKDEGDWRAIPALKTLTATTGCGFLKRSDCYGCLHRDSSLKDAIAAIEARTLKK